MTQPTAELRDRIETTIGPAEVFVDVEGGYTPAHRWLVSLESGEQVFVKAGSSEDTSNWLRAETANYEAFGRQPFLPEVLAADDDGVQPFLVLEDLSSAHWPPPWKPEQVDLVRETLETLAAMTNLDHLPKLSDDQDLRACWRRVAADPEPFLGLELVTMDWLHQSLDLLLTAEQFLDLDGDLDVLHCDVRSDNLCFADDGVKLVDWNFACRGNRRFDVGAWLPSLHVEGGPAPETIAGAESGDVAALVSGFFAARAGLPSLPHAPRVRQVQVSQLRAALPWVIRTLDLPPADGERSGLLLTDKDT